MLRIKLVKSPIGNSPRNRATVEALGLRKIGQVVEKEDSASIRGMIHKIHHMLVVEAPEGADFIVDSTHPGSSSRMLRSNVHRNKKPNETHRHGEQK